MLLSFLSVYFGFRTVSWLLLPFQILSVWSKWLNGAFWEIQLFLKEDWRNFGWNWSRTLQAKSRTAGLMGFRWNKTNAHVRFFLIRHFLSDWRWWSLFVLRVDPLVLFMEFVCFSFHGILMIFDVLAQYFVKDHDRNWWVLENRALNVNNLNQFWIRVDWYWCREIWCKAGRQGWFVVFW